MVALNAARRAKGRPRVGFAPPLLYALAAARPGAAFHGVGGGGGGGGGSNRCTMGACCKFGFAAGGGGWDPVTGLGTPNVTALLELDDALFDGAAFAVLV